MLWQKSPQYQGMPHDQYMKTDEGKRSQQAFLNWGNWDRTGMSGGSAPQSQKPSWQKQDGSFDYMGWMNSPGRYSPDAQQAWQQAGSPKSFRPGQAQPIQPQSQGTPYGQQPPFMQSMYTPFGQMNPNQYYQQRDAFIQTANDQMGQYMANGGVYQGQGAPPPAWGQPPQFNPMQMWGQAGDMVQQGWQNPYTQPAQNSQYDDWAARPAYRQVGAPTNAQFYGEKAQEQFQKYAAQNQQAPPQQTPPPAAPQQDAQQKWAANFAKMQQQSLADHNKMMSNMDAWSMSQKRAIDAANPRLQGRPAATTPPPPPAAPAPKYNAADYRRNDGSYDYTGARQGWSAQHAKQVAAPANKNWLAGMSPANRRIYSMMQ